MYVFVATVKPDVSTRTIDIDCPNCGRNTIVEKRIDQVLSVFFIPFLTVRKGQPYRYCVECGWDACNAGGRGPYKLEDRLQDGVSLYWPDI